jgi:hypothetical protein
MSAKKLNQPPILQVKEHQFKLNRLIGAENPQQQHPISA